ncbi:hypothetical protein CFC21_088940 [Triticum aestivum]|uniref:F-box domain-containing protein n=3 Tax=Triticum TaxID=4564 RepID=A0A9R1B7A1_TRITD|nr:hypothetical protein CFC21_088940 [Triticum aestivum]VAI54126.1 unnamed protein product [Triticum turgidum subsp. durum]
MSSLVSPLYGVVEASQWDAERLLGRLVIVVHAAFLESGFIVARRHSGDPSSTCRLPTEVGATASTLSLEYTAPQLLPRHDMDGAALRMCTNGRHVIFYLQLQVCSVQIRTYWVCLDTLSVAPLLSSGLDDTGRRLLGSDGSRTATLWRSLTDGFCHRILSDICREHGVVLGRAPPPRAPTLTSLPGDAMVAILESLADGKDLVSVESTCTELRRFVADRDRQLWLPRYKALPGNTLWWSLLCDIDSDDDLPAASWKEMFVWATRQRDHRLVLPTPSPFRSSPWYSSFNGRVDGDVEEDDSFEELPVDAAACFGEMMTETEDDGEKNTTGRRHGHGKAPATGGHEKQKQQGRRSRTGTGAIYSPSARYRWKHR